MLEVLALSMFSFCAILCVLTLRGGLRIIVKHETQKDTELPESCHPSAEELKALQEKADEEYMQTTKAIKDMSSVLQEFMCGPEKKGDNLNGR